MKPKTKKIVLSIIFIIFVLIYCFSEGATEGYTWASETERLNNKIISPRIDKGEAILDYHSFRTLEMIGIWGALLITLILAVSFKRYLLLAIGSWFLGMGLIYERVLQYVCKGVLFEPHPPKYNILWFSIQSSNKLEIAIGGIGIILLIIYFKFLLFSKK